MQRDDETGLPSVRPSIESDRSLYSAISDWEGETSPPHPDAPPIPEVDEHADEEVRYPVREQAQERFWARFQEDMAV